MAKLFGSSGDKKETDNSKYRVNELNKLLMCQYYELITNKLQISDGYPGWSPNNVKRVIISPDGVCVEYHMASILKGNTNKKYAYKVFDIQKTVECLNSPKAKSILSVFSDNRVYSAIEEIVILTTSARGLTLRADELDLSGIGIQNKADMKKSLESRYKRLVHIVLIEDMDIQTLLTMCYSTKEVHKEFRTIYDVYREHTNGNGRVTCLRVGGTRAYANMPNLQGYSTDGKGYFVDTQKANCESLGIQYSGLRDYFEERTEKYTDKLRSEKIAQRKASADTSDSMNNVEVPLGLSENTRVVARLFNLTLELAPYFEKFFNRDHVREIMIKDMGSLGKYVSKIDTLLRLNETKFAGVQQKYETDVYENMGYMDCKELIVKVTGRNIIKPLILKSILHHIETATRGMEDTARYEKIGIGMKAFNIYLANGILGQFCEPLVNCKNSKAKMYNTIFNKIANETFYIPKVPDAERYAFTEVGKLFENCVEVDRSLDECLVVDLALMFYLYSNLFTDRKKVTLEAVTYPRWKKVIEKLYMKCK